MPELGALWADAMRGEGMPPVPAARVALPEDIWCRAKVTFWAGDFHFTKALWNEQHLQGCAQEIPRLYLP